jgi:hypothetical protein
VRLFCRIRGFFKIFSEKWWLFSLMWDILKDFEAFKKNYQRSGGFVLKCVAFIKMTRLFEIIFREIETLSKITRLLKYNF